MEIFLAGRQRESQAAKWLGMSEMTVVFLKLEAGQLYTHGVSEKARQLDEH